jgi:phospholipid transport system substrate-binding protein
VAIFITALRRIFTALLLAILCSAGAVPARAGPQDAATFIDDFGHRAIAALTAPNLSDQELVKRFKVLFEEGFDVPYVARSALGRFWLAASDQERADYVPLFEEYISWVYAMQFRHYSGETFKADRTRPGPEDMVTVLSTVVRPDGTVTRIEWVVGNIDGKMKIRDIRIEGVSMIISHRDGFANVIAQRGGKVAGLIEALRNKIAELQGSGTP